MTSSTVKGIEMDIIQWRHDELVFALDRRFKTDESFMLLCVIIGNTKTQLF